jgi:hypothetical protein
MMSFTLHGGTRNLSFSDMCIYAMSLHAYAWCPITVVLPVLFRGHRRKRRILLCRLAIVFFSLLSSGCCFLLGSLTCSQGSDEAVLCCACWKNVQAILYGIACRHHMNAPVQFATHVRSTSISLEMVVS